MLRGLNLGADLSKLTSQDRRDFLVISYPLASDIPSVAASRTDVRSLARLEARSSLMSGSASQSRCQ